MATTCAVIILLFSLTLFIATLCFGGCIDSERDALLRFKNDLYDPSDRLSDWVFDGSDCCRWTGIVCDNITAHAHVIELHLETRSPQDYDGLDHYDPVYEEYRKKSALRGNVSSSLLELKHLSYLDLSYNDFGGSPIPKFLGSLRSLRYLNLAYCGFRGIIPPQLGNLSDLHYLNLRSKGQISSGIRNLTSLISLDMSGNIDLEFEKGIPNSFKNFCNLKLLDVSNVKLNQEINDVLAIMSSGCVSNVLRSLQLTNCQLSGHLTEDMSYLKNLISFDISSNLISGPIPLSFGELNSLVILNIENNMLNGSLPVSFGNLVQLEEIYISNNKLEGVVSHLHFADRTRLVRFEASGNNIALRVSSNWVPPLQLQSLMLRCWHIGPQFPNWLSQLKHLTYLDLSNSGISTSVPIWFWDLFSNNYYDYLNFSHNQIHGSIPNIPFANGFNMVIDLSSNCFSGVLPYFSSNVTALDVSNNSFSGSIFDFLCYDINEEKKMQILNLEKNHFHSEIADCWSSWKRLTAIRLSFNMFYGNIPNSIGTLSSLESLHLCNNNLSGEIPMSIQNCKRLVILDVSENNLVGNIPTWFGDGFDNLSILSLHANRFHNNLPMELCRLISLHILNLAQNNFSSTIPRCFSNFTGMTTRNDLIGSFYSFSSGRTFIESNLIVMKGRVMEYTNNLRLVRSIDLAENNLSGEIPMELMSITGLLSLNLSHNALTGRIPNNIGDMKGLEAIDFSHNQLSGGIPESMSLLTFLSTLNLSYNNLSGRIPSSTQLQSFDASSFIGNQLCGLPLNDNCILDNAQLWRSGLCDVEVDEWFYVSMAFGFVFGFWSVVGSLIFIRRWRHFYFRSLSHLGEKIWWNFICRLY